VNGRHPETEHALRMLSPNANLHGDLYEIAVACNALATTMAKHLPDGPELTTGLRKLLEAKDCFVRAAL
jgi:hypothetical protein